MTIAYNQARVVVFMYLTGKADGGFPPSARNELLHPDYFLLTPVLRNGGSSFASDRSNTTAFASAK